MGNFYREFSQLRCTELQLKMRLAGLHLQLKRVAHEVVAGRPTEFSISSDNLNWGNSPGKIFHWVLYGISWLTIVIAIKCHIYTHISAMDSLLNFKLSRPKIRQNKTKIAKTTHVLMHLWKKFKNSIGQLIKASQRFCSFKGPHFKS